MATTTTSNPGARDAATGNTDEDFRTKYVKTNAITRRLLAGFFDGIGSLMKEPGPADVRSAIEVGCGEGFSTEKLRTMLPRDASFRASDVEQRLVDEARARNPNVPIERESIYELPHADNAFDLVFVLEVLEHLDDPTKALAEVCRVSKRWVIASVPREPIWRMLNFARLKYVTALGNTPGHLNHWSANGFRNFVGRQAAVRARRTPLPWTMVLAEVQPSNGS
jgi:2-polyprenyl-3-methyl-5-hydroxy-6-metoxy-1,4-benzoquinol methylase